MSSDIVIYRLHELRDMPKPEWLIDGILHRNTLAAIAATKAAFKTFLALDWGLSIATGRDWQGRKVVQGNVLHLVGEGASGINLRTEAWQQHNDVWLPEPSPWSCTVTSVDLLTKADALLQAIVREFPTGIELLVVDTLARNNSGDENSTVQMSELVRQVDMVRTALGCTVLFLHHFNRGGSFRGNTALDGAFDTVVLLDRKPAGGEVVTVRCDKQKDADEFEPFQLKRKIVGESMVLEPDDDISPYVTLLARVVGQNGAKGMTREMAKDTVACMTPRPFGTTVFNDAWQQAVDREVIEPKDGLKLAKGTLWVRNLRSVDIAA